MESLPRRRSTRTFLEASAVVRTEDESFTASCLVHNLSLGGAKIRVDTHDPLPTEFILFLRPGSQIGRRCQIVWRVGNRVGVRFLSTYDLDSRRHKGTGVWAPA